MSRSAILVLETLFTVFLLFVLIFNVSELGVSQTRHQRLLQPVESTSTGNIVLNGLENGALQPSSVPGVNQNPSPDKNEAESQGSVDTKSEDYQSPSSSKIKQYIEDIFNPKNRTSISRLGCKNLTTNRYDHLKSPSMSQFQPQYYFALNLQEHRDTLPSFLYTVIETITFLGPSKAFLSIVSHDSKDGTAEMLSALKPSLDTLHIGHSIIHTNDQPSSSTLRNLTLSPLFSHPTAFSPETTILFLDGTPLCTDDLLELLYAVTTQSGDLLCGMDYIDGGLRYYNSLRDLFWNDERVRAQFVDKAPFQVFSCWSGAVAVTARPFLEHGVRFRELGEGPKDCGRYGDEAVRLAAEMWEAGFQRVAIAPSVSLVSEKVGKRRLHAARVVKRARGYTVENVERSERRRRQDSIATGVIEWRKELPNWALCGGGHGKGTQGKQPVWDKGPVMPVTGCR